MLWFDETLRQELMEASLEELEPTLEKLTCWEQELSPRYRRERTRLWSDPCSWGQSHGAGGGEHMAAADHAEWHIDSCHIHLRRSGKGRPCAPLAGHLAAGGVDAGERHCQRQPRSLGFLRNRRRRFDRARS